MVSLAEVVLGQSTFFNGHGQMEISEMELGDVHRLAEELNRSKGVDTFCVKINDEGSCADIYEKGALEGSGYGPHKLWLGVNKLISKGEEND